MHKIDRCVQVERFDSVSAFLPGNRVDYRIYRTGANNIAIDIVL